MSVSKKVLRKMKKVMGVIGAVPVLTACSSQISCAAKTWRDGNVRYTFDEKQLLIEDEIEGEGKGTINRKSIELNLTKEEMENISKIHIDLGITEIGESAFENFIKLKSINIPNSVKEIGKFAFFRCKSLVNIVIPRSVNSIGPLAFYSCKSLQDAEILGNVKTIDIGTFKECGLRKFKVPESVVTIREEALSRCYELSEIECAGNGLNELMLEKDAFYDCNNLKKFDASGRAVCVDKYTFDRCLKTFAKLGGSIISGCHCACDDDEVISLRVTNSSVSQKGRKLMVKPTFCRRTSPILATQYMLQQLALSNWPYGKVQGGEESTKEMTERH